MLTSAFHFEILSRFADCMTQKAEVMNECIANSLKKNPDQPINIFDFAAKCTLETFCETAMGINEDMQHKTHNDYLEAIEKLVEFLNANEIFNLEIVCSPILLTNLLDLPD